MANNLEEYPNNACCLCLNLRIGVVIVALSNCFFNLLSFSWYTTSPISQQHLPPTSIDVSLFSLFILQILVDGFLIYGAIKRLHANAIPWLCVNSIIMGIILIMVSFFLFFGSARLTLNHSEYISVLLVLGIVGAIHLFSCMVVFQFRKNLIEENRIRLANAAAMESAEMPVNYVRPSSPPPTYEEVTLKKSSQDLDSDEIKINLDGIRRRNSIDDSDEAPPEYFTAIANISQTNYSSPSNSIPVAGPSGPTAPPLKEIENGDVGEKESFYIDAKPSNGSNLNGVHNETSNC